MNNLKPLRSIKEITLLVFCGTVGIAIGLFAAFRLLQGEWSLAAHNSFISAAAIALFIRVWVYREIYFSGIFISSLCVMGATSVVYIGGADHIYWIYPGFMAPFFMAGTRTAIVLCCFGLMVLVPKFWMLADPLVFARVLLAFFVNLIFGVTFLSASNIHRSDLERKAKTDGLTGIANRRALDEALRVLSSGHTPQNIEISVLMMDLDHFKTVNDQFGHVEGDRVLVEFAQLIQKFLADEAAIYRYGGEEFTVIVSSTKGQGLVLAERIRHFIEKSEILTGYAITISVGVAIMHANDSADSVLLRSDMALLDAKAQGRNRIMVADKAGDTSAYLRVV